MGIYERIRKLYQEAEQKAAEERSRQQRETELLRAASSGSPMRWSLMA